MANRLADSQSLYLQKHAQNPIDWWSWCDEALATAQQDNRPIFLSIGYSSCHWCTVMEGEAFSDPDIADYLNRQFLPIKVDREERPDLDSIYMQALQLMTGQGGWPLNIFLTPGDLVPFYGGTYFSVDPRYGRPGFLQLLQTLRHLYDQDPERLQDIKGQVLQELQRSQQTPQPETLEPDTLHRGIDYCTGVVAASGHGPSFPMIPYADVALRGTRFQDRQPFNYDGYEACTQRGLDLALGGIYDHVAGGFHRYTVDPNWTVPHFEKMLYDNGQILEYLANLWSLGVHEPAFERAIAGTVRWLQREMMAAAGYCYAAQDADSFLTPDAAEPEEGAFYVWDYAELDEMLSPPQLEELQTQFSVSESGNFEGHNVLQRHQSGVLSATLETTLASLFAIRYGASQVSTVPPARNNQDARNYPGSGRIPPVTDPKMIVAWNSLMISGLARASVVFQRAEYLDLAATIGTWILEHQRISDRLHRLNYEGHVSLFAQSEDYALFIKALLDLQQASLMTSGDRAQRWLQQAQDVQAEFDQFFWSEAEGGYYNTASDAGHDLLIRERSYVDNATPAANGVAIANLVRLFLLTEKVSYLDRAEVGLQTFSPVIKASPRSCPSLISALDWFQNATVVRSRSEQVATLLPRYWPTVMFQIAHDLPESVVGLVCQGLSCAEPALTVEQLHIQLQRMGCRVC
jgi:uncharacterized protein